MKTKGKRKAIETRRLRKAEKRSDAFFDAMRGDVSRRGWFKGVVR